MDMATCGQCGLEDDISKFVFNNKSMDSCQWDIHYEGPAVHCIECNSALDVPEEPKFPGRGRLVLTREGE